MAEMNRRSVLTLPALLLATPALLLATPVLAQAPAAVLSARDRADVARIEVYLNQLRSLHSRFLQVAPNGGMSQGQAWLVRPGRMRFQYDPPSPFLLVGGHGLLVFYDSQLKQTSNIPIDSTPLGLLLQDNLRLSGEITIVSFARQPGALQVGVVRTRSPGDGTLTLYFTDQPLALRQWTVLDAQRQETRVTLSNVEVGGTYPDSLFEFIDPRFFQNNQGGG